jgi:ABC-type molybdate transport system permease subunit
MTFGIVCIIVGALGVAGGIWLAREKRAASVVGGIVIALLSLVPILLGALLLAYIAAP